MWGTPVGSYTAPKFLTRFRAGNIERPPLPKGDHVSGTVSDSPLATSSPSGL